MISYWKEILLVIAWSIILIGGTLISTKQITEKRVLNLVEQNQRMKIMLQNTQIVIWGGINGEKISWQNFADIGYNILPDSVRQR